MSMINIDIRMPTDQTRRRFIATTGIASVAALAGCAGNGDGGDGSEEDGGDSGDGGTANRLSWHAGGTGGTYFPLSNEIKTIVAITDSAVAMASVWETPSAKIG